ncbi:hypothetical protein [Cryobacterium levicorallinum]|uniref:hypothetical protein n=1 Tax=Cryobacterium levicorallinum TaxID=995038 RepID=UPI00141B86F7|nr:hypothetical protein [Cryobacterium levicorallinum]
MLCAHSCSEPVDEADATARAASAARNSSGVAKKIAGRFGVPAGVPIVVVLA